MAGTASYGVFAHARALMQILTKGEQGALASFLDYHLVRRKFIMSRACEHFSRDKHEPAPLLGLSLLDVGCGTSRLAEELCFRGADCTAIDVNITVLEHAEHQANEKGSTVQFLKSTAEDLVQTGATFDIILCLDVIEHVPDAQRLVWAISRLLAPGGLVVFSTISRTPKAWLYMIAVGEYVLGWFPRGYSAFRRFRSPGDMTSLFAKNTLEVQHLTGLSFNPITLAWEKTDDLTIRYAGTASRPQG
jgi:2-polyprenyl-6-hydroxyphenyl methylase/3-demethylubiquinone-9 3-methyltransferase